MKPASQLKEVSKNLYGWQSFHSEWKIDFDCYALKTPEGVVFIDPIKPEPPVIKKLEALGEPIGIYLTNAHHDRNADWFRKQYQVQIYAHAKAKPDCDTKLDVLVLDGEKLLGGVKAIYMPGSSDSEMAFYSKLSGGIVLMGDTLLNLPEKGLSFLPEQYIEDKQQALQSLRKLLEIDFKILTFAHGDPLVGNAKQELAQFLKKPKKKTK